MAAFVATSTPLRRPGRRRTPATRTSPPLPIFVAVTRPTSRPSPPPPSSTAAAPSFTRRSALATAAAALLSAVVGAPSPAAALDINPSKADLLKRAGSGRTKEEAAAARAAAVEERRARMEAVAKATAEREAASRGTAPRDATADAIEPTLRGSYYSPTAKLRYLPRVRRAAESLDDAVVQAADGNWAELAEMASPTGALGDAAAPMRLYASSLAGQGLSIASRAAKEMDAAGEDYAGAIARLSKGIKKRSSGTVGPALDDLRAAMTAFRRAGRMEADWGLPEITSTQKVGAAFGNNNPALYARNSGIRGGPTGTAAAGEAAGKEPADVIRSPGSVLGKRGVGRGSASGFSSSSDMASTSGLLDSGAASGAATLGAGEALGKGW